jgi:hypothetical protein
VTDNCTAAHQQIEGGSCSTCPNPHLVDLPLDLPIRGRRHRMSRRIDEMRGDFGLLHGGLGGRMGSRVSYLLDISCIYMWQCIELTDVLSCQPLSIGVC